MIYTHWQSSVHVDPTKDSLGGKLLGRSVMRITYDDSVHGEITVQVDSVGGSRVAEHDAFSFQLFDKINEVHGGPELPGGGIACRTII